MSARDIIREIEALPPEERRIVRDYLLQAEDNQEDVRRMERSKAEAIAERVFADHAELFKKLAQ
ncbi:hypothetical protein DES53_114135 [Roseimicrobium gellanilyticum]|uniref:Addiction module component n=1 Tax=Roseimicrobium gellanilyticum TaxID=748857 RepID=A0A366H5Q7_9BACT|nr:hypothetical protein [Roseimicrobium gellanilyticum]RBP37397.1 hypothetical protein DES53_114135 [Roseimicrobium gellanilyticum]